MHDHHVRDAAGCRHYLAVQGTGRGLVQTCCACPLFLPGQTWLYRQVVCLQDHHVRDELLAHIAREASQVRAEGWRALKVLSDIDDTFLCSGGHFPSGGWSLIMQPETVMHRLHRDQAFACGALACLVAAGCRLAQYSTSSSLHCAIGNSGWQRESVSHASWGCSTHPHKLPRIGCMHCIGTPPP